ncbi:MAG: purine-nucleoside phosphorylase [Cystobacterineae bacterium]|nr:purine-nucleoside phosphorylase [Cystobacterineae bacterium]
MLPPASLSALVDASASAIKNLLPHVAPPRLGFVLGSGLGFLVERFENSFSLPYAQIPHFATSSVQGHEGKLVFGLLCKIPVVALQGRSHAYEGVAPWHSAFPSRVLCRLGIEALVLTNAAGGIEADMRPGEFMAIVDHINFSGANPLTGPNDPSLGPRFLDLSRLYCPHLLERMRKAAKACAVPLREGVYAMMAGPAYETPAEIRMLRMLGAQAVGMSTVYEAMAAHHMGTPVAALSCISNLAAGLAPLLSHSEVMQTSAQAAAQFCALLEGFVHTFKGAHL